MLGGELPDGLPGDDALERAIVSHTAFIDLVLRAQREPALEEVADALAHCRIARGRGAGWLRPGDCAARPGGRRPWRRWSRSSSAAQLFSGGWLAGASRSARSGQPFSDMAGVLESSIDTLEGVVRVQTGLAKLQPGRGRRCRSSSSSRPAKRPGGRPCGRWCWPRRSPASSPPTRCSRTWTAGGSAALFERYRELDAKKSDLVRDAILHHWVGKQKERLLADTGSRLNAIGAELQRRLTLRGERAMRLRQVVAVGGGIEGGDPLFDLCPVWMASPETVAQLFPREPIFDVVVFDEASQCRLEEALPVLAARQAASSSPATRSSCRRRGSSKSAVAERATTRTSRPTRSCSSCSRARSRTCSAAALGLDIEQCYLDVHYRSRNADLIEFSNEHFYGSRLQPIPGHPPPAAAAAGARCYRVGGIYEKRRTRPRRTQVVEIVQELLGREEPPSIGIACFNLQQRDLIVEKLDEAGRPRTPDFGRRLAAARTRRGAGSFEGLFVKNLENVQGDERDHIIISTTYGPDTKGKFYRRFGPLGMAGGGRRLNVLVTRARDEVHLVTSIPPESYRSLRPLEPGRRRAGRGCCSPT